MIKYKLREEKQGAILFDQLKGQIKELSEQEYQDILKNNSEEYKIYKSKIPREKLPSDCLSAPSKVYFEITRKCNLNCKYCYNKSNVDFENQLNKEQIFKLLDELSEPGTFEIRFTGGEPTIHPDFFEIVDYADKLGFYISLGTNGVWNKNTLEKIKKSAIRTIIISLDGPAEYNDSKRGKGTFEKIISTLNSLRKNKDLFLKINCVLCKDNKKYVDYMIKLADFFDINVINFATLKLSGRASKNNNLLSSKDIYEVVKKISKLRKKHKVKIQTYLDILDKKKQTFQSSLINKKSCAAGIEVAAISPFGEVYGCVVSAANELKQSKAKKLFTAGNINKDKFVDIWLDSSRWSVFRNLKKVKSKKCLNCKFYAKTCFGNCVVESYLQNEKLNSDNLYCFVEQMGVKDGN